MVHDLVVVGASAGGIEALSALVSSLPHDFPAPIVVAQHLDPNKPSVLASILERRSTVPVVVVDRRIELEEGKVYVTPPNRHVTILDGFVSVDDEPRGRPVPSIDLLLSTAAASYGEHLFALILSGSGSDGAAGAVDVKAAGGTVIIQNPERARHPSMPLALPPTVVDHVVDLEGLGATLARIIARPPTPHAPGQHSELQAILSLIESRTHVDFQAYKPATMLRRIERRMAVTHVDSMAAYAQYLEQHPEEVANLARAFLIKVTEFMRDPEAFVFLKEHILPARIAWARERDRVLRFWSAGCATGEEPYSLAMMIADLLGDELPSWSVKIFATDLDLSAIEFARRGAYPASFLKRLPPDYVTRYFDSTPYGMQIVKSVRSMLVFGQQDLGRGAPFPRIDLILCRNLLIYFKPELQQTVLDRFSFSLHPGKGYLFLGKAETARPSKATYELVDKRWKVYRCEGSGLLGAGVSRLHSPTPARRLRGRELEAHRRPPVEVDVAPPRKTDEALIALLPIGVALIDRSYRVLSMNAAARRILRSRETIGADQDFLHAARALPYMTVRTAIDAAFRDRARVDLEQVELDRVIAGDVHVVSLTLTPVPPDADALMITVSDVTAECETRRRLEAVQAEQGTLVNELSAANTRLGDINKDLQDANEEHQAANEEMVITQEELQATNEELESTNEEFQATNEELETSNEELQATNEELSTTNDELNARTQELQDMARTIGVQARTAEELSRIDRLKDEFLSLVSHELRTPMSTLRAYASMMRDAAHGKAPVGTTIEEAVAKFDRQLEHLNRMIDDLFDVARMEGGRLSLELRPLDFAALVRTAVAGAGDLLPRHRIHLEIEQGELSLQGDGDRLSQLVVNLLQNAATHAAVGSPIEVRVWPMKRAGSDVDEVCLTVRDHGPGLDPEAIGSLFMRFYHPPTQERPARSGLGLGLFICKQIAEQHGGSIGVESVFGAGSTFVVRLPLSPLPSPLPSKASTDPSKQGATT